MTLNDICRAAHDNAVAHGFWSPPRDFGRLLALIHSEVSEALEADRELDGLDGWADAVSEELADVVIRVADICGAYGIDLDAAVQEKMAKNADRPYRHGKVSP